MSDEIKNCPECQRKSRPLDRGKVLAWASKEMDSPETWWEEGYFACLTRLKDQINSGRLDVEEG